MDTTRTNGEHGQGAEHARRRTDVELMLRAAFGAQQDSAIAVQAFGELARRWRPALVRFFAAMLSDSAGADDAAQETLLRLWLLRGRYRPTGRFDAYLFTLARHFGLNEQTRARRARPAERHHGAAAENDALLLAAPATVSEPERIVLQQHEHRRVRTAISQLPAHYQIVFTLSHDDGLRYAEIATRLGIPVGTVKSRMAEAVRRLRQTLSQNAGDEP